MKIADAATAYSRLEWWLDNNWAAARAPWLIKALPFEVFPPGRSWPFAVVRPGLELIVCRVGPLGGVYWEYALTVAQLESLSALL